MTAVDGCRWPALSTTQRRDRNPAVRLTCRAQIPSVAFLRRRSSSFVALGSLYAIVRRAGPLPWSGVAPTIWQLNGPWCGKCSAEKPPLPIKAENLGSDIMFFWEQRLPLLRVTPKRRCPRDTGGGKRWVWRGRILGIGSQSIPATDPHHQIRSES